jgi:tRNA (Thr-GGU) A37 N-methylase
MNSITLKVIGYVESPVKEQTDEGRRVDVKPYFPAYDRVENATAPEWADRVMEGYF